MSVSLSESSSEPQPAPFTVPEGFTVHSENSARILLPKDNGAFLNPVQEFNRDLSVACIRTWGDQMNEAKRKKWEVAQEKKAAKDVLQHGSRAKTPRSAFLQLT